MASPLRIGLIGYGGFGQIHREKLEACEKKGTARLTAVADPTFTRQPQWTESLESQGIPWFPDHRVMLETTDLDAVVIAAPIPYHEAILRDCLATDLHIYLEKPPVPLIGQLEEMIALDPKHRVTVGFQLVNARWAEFIKNCIVSGRLGEITGVSARCCWPRDDVYYDRAEWAGKMSVRGLPVFDGPATNALSHLIHNLMYFGSTKAGGFEAPVSVEAELYRARPIESYDMASMRGTLKNGVTFHCAVAHATTEHLSYCVEVRGTDGWISFTENGNQCESSFGSTELPEDFHSIMERSYEKFLAYVRGETSTGGSSLKDTRGYILATNAMLLSSDGIRTLPESFAPHVKHGESHFYHVAGLRVGIEKSSEKHQIFSEMSFPWAIAPKKVSLEHITKEQIAEIARYF